MTNRDHQVFMDRETDTISRIIEQETEQFVSRQDDAVERYPEIPGYLTLKKASQNDIEVLIEKIYDGYEARIRRMNPPDLSSARIMAMGSVPTGFPAIWRGVVDQSVWREQPAAPYSLNDIYQSALEHSNQIKVFSDIPLIRETGMQEADGEFDIETFIDGRMIRRNEPNGSALTGLTPGVTRLRENQNYLEGGLRKKFFTGGEMSVSNRLGVISNNTNVLVPQNQGSSELVLSVVQPVLEGAGYHYNQSRVKLAKFDASMASAEFVRQLQSHLIEVNRAYWALYYARSYYILNRDLVTETSEILAQLEARADLDALQSEVLRSRAALAMRKAMLNRAEMAIRNSEERLRALVNDPRQDIGSNSEMIPCTPPVLSKVTDNVRSVAIDALRNRPEITQGFEGLRAAIVRREMMKNEKLPTLNLVAEMMLGDINPNDRTGAAFSDQFGDGTGYVLGFEFEAPIDNDVARARHLRSELELRQQVNQLRSTIDIVLLESVVSYRELMTAFRDMQGRFSALQASREELRQLRERMEVDTEEEDGKTTSAQLQLILDSMDRNQSAEELFLDAVVAYNAAFASLDRARGTFLKKEKVEIERVRDTDPAHPNSDLERLNVTKNGTSTRGASYFEGVGDLNFETVPNVPPLADGEFYPDAALPEWSEGDFASAEAGAPQQLGSVAVRSIKPSAKVKPAAASSSNSNSVARAPRKASRPGNAASSAPKPSSSVGAPRPVASASVARVAAPAPRPVAISRPASPTAAPPAPSSNTITVTAPAVSAPEPPAPSSDTITVSAPAASVPEPPAPSSDTITVSAPAASAPAPPVRRVRIGVSSSGAIQSKVETVPSATPAPN